MPTYNYGDYVGMSPLCQARCKQYPDIDPMNSDDWEDAQHQWSYYSSTLVMQKCFDCNAIRPIPLHGYGTADQIHIMRTALLSSGFGKK